MSLFHICIVVLLFVHICITVVYIQFSEEENYFPINRLNPATFVSIFLLIVHVCIALLTFNILNPATFACVTFLLFVHICIAVVDIQFSREEDHYPIHRLNPATFVSFFSYLYY